MRPRRPHPALQQDPSSKLRSVILGQFDPVIASQLIEFGKFLSGLDVDVLVFMARKSLCLYDLLVTIGIPPVDKVILSDRALDLNTEHLSGKTVALIDDTLIVGTTIAKTKDFLSSIEGVQVTVHVFCADTAWQDDRIVKPDTVFVRADDRTVMNFCASLVRAMSLLPRPYLVDFPLTTQFRIRSGDLQCVLSSTSWRVFRLSSPLQINNGVEVYTFLPQVETLSSYLDSLDADLRKYIDIAKVRTFSRQHEELMWTRAVPIITLLPLTEATVSGLVSRILKRLHSKGADTETLHIALANPIAQQRFIQFLLSAALGKLFFSHLTSSIGSNVEVSYDETDIERHYGPWFSDAILRSLDSLEHLLLGDGDQPTPNIAPIPKKMKDLAKEVLDAAALSVYRPKTPGFQRNLVVDCSTLFVQMYRVREIPARQEAMRLGHSVIRAKSEDAPYRDRLNVGLPWSAVATHLGLVTGQQQVSVNSIMTSLALDICNDLGIVVPITCACDGVILRAYRYGEDAPFGDSELRLAYEAVKGFLISSQRESMTHLSLEKLLVFLVRAGVATQFLRPFYGQSGADGTARVGFALKGAVVVISRGPRDRCDRDIWLTQHLCERNILVVDEQGLYRLGDVPDSDGNSKLSLTKAKQLGLLLGHCVNPAGPAHDVAPLDVRSLILLMTCCTPHHAAAALEVELDIFRSWYEATRRTWQNKIRWNDRSSLDRALEDIRKSAGYEAIHSGMMKYEGYINGDVAKIINDCSLFLSKIGSDEVFRDLWDGTWEAITGMEVPAQEKSFSDLMNDAAILIAEIGVALSSFEVALEIAVKRLSTSKTYKGVDRAINKLKGFAGAAKKLQGIPSYIHKLSKMVDMEIETVESIDHEKLGIPCLKHLDNCMPRVEFLVDRMEPIIEQYGRQLGKHVYRYFIYYDIIDSTATQAARRCNNAEQHEERVAGLKNSINNTMESMHINARKHRGEVYCTNGNLYSTNDCKHIFISGKFARKYVEECIYKLFYLTASYPGIHLRIYALSCEFVKSEAYRMHNAEEVSGLRFWTNWSRVLKESKKFEDTVGYDSSFLFVGGEQLYGSLNLSFADWEKEDAVVQTELAEAFRRLNVRYGALKMPRLKLQATA